MTPVWPIREGRGVKLTGYLDSPHMVSYYLPVHFIALNAILKKIMGGWPKFKAFRLEGLRKSLINETFFKGLLPKSNQLAFSIV